MVKLTDHDSLSRETVRRRWPRTISSPGRRTCGASPRSTPSTSPAWRMSLDLYAEQPDPEAAGEGLLRRKPQPAHRRSASSNPGSAGTARTLRLRVSPQRAPSISLSSLTHIALGAGSRSLVVAPLDDFAVCVREPRRSRLQRSRAHPRRPRQPLHPHRCRSLRRIPTGRSAARLPGGLSSTTRPSIASWLNMVEIKIGVFQRPMSRSPHRNLRPTLVAEIHVWQSQRNQSGARITWMFSTDKARTKMARAYPDPSLKES